MIFFSHKCGQMGNRLFAFGHLIAFSITHNIPIVNLSFDEYAEYFESTNNNIFCHYPPKKTWILLNGSRSFLFLMNRVILRFLRTIGFNKSFIHNVVIADLPEYDARKDRFFDLGNLVANNTLKPFTFLFGRFFRDYRNFEKYQNEIRRYFEPNQTHQANISRFMLDIRNNCDLVVGVHIRGGDYQQFIGGKYFYSQLQYLEKMRQFQDAIPHRKIKFIICSNNALNPKVFESVDFSFGPNHQVEDMYILAECDLIMGPPSTYSLWASFYGNKLLYQIRDISYSPQLKDFIKLPPETLFNFSFV